MSNDRDFSALPDPEPDPYAPPKEAIGEGAMLEGSEDLARAEAIRRRYLNHEASVKSIGHLHYLGVVIGILGLLGSSVQIYSLLAAGGVESAQAVGMIVYFLVVISINLVMGVGLTGLKTWARWIEVALTILSLLYCLLVAAGFSFFFGRSGPGVGLFLFMSIIPIYILYLLLSKKGSMVFSSEYREIIDATPHIKYRSSWIVKGCVIAFVLLIVFATLVAFFAPRR